MCDGEHAYVRFRTDNRTRPRKHPSCRGVSHGNSQMDARTSNLCNLVELLEDARVFHDEAARSSATGIRRRHIDKALCYASMLTETRHWEDGRQQGRFRPADAATPEPGRDSLPALMDRIYRKQRALFA